MSQYYLITLGKPVLHYYPIRGRAEPIRLLLQFLKIEWSQKPVPIRFLPGSLETFNQVRDSFEFRKTPVLQIDGHMISETKAILRYLASKNGLHPTDPYQAWRVDSLADHYSDMESEITTTFKSDEVEKSFKEFIEQILDTRSSGEATSRYHIKSSLWERH